tara:strand:+ start:71 stop:433 length:363 start_codon:yes stop_codon:yes gene_type:complete
MKPLLMLVTMALFFLSGCASAVKRHEQVQGHLNKAVDCAEAHLDIATLELQKTTTREKLVNGVASVLPTSILLNVILGEYGSRAAIATGAFDRTVDNKINVIESDCMLDDGTSDLMLVKQ